MASLDAARRRAETFGGVEYYGGGRSEQLIAESRGQRRSDRRAGPARIECDAIAIEVLERQSRLVRAKERGLPLGHGPHCEWFRREIVTPELQ